MQKTKDDLFSTNYKITTDRLEIYPFGCAKESINHLYEIYSDIENSKGFCSPHLDGFNFFEYYMNDKYQKFQIDQKCVYIFVIKEISSGKFIGVRNIIFDNRELFDGLYFNPNYNIITETAINKKYWGMGYGNESSKAMFNFLSKFDFKNILTFVTPDNFKAQNHINKLGFNNITYLEAIFEYGYLKDVAKHTFDINKDLIYVKNNSL